jgi:hypothetical protein
MKADGMHGGFARAKTPARKVALSDRACGIDSFFPYGKGSSSSLFLVGQALVRDLGADGIYWDLTTRRNLAASRLIDQIAAPQLVEDVARIAAAETIEEQPIVAPADAKARVLVTVSLAM